MTLEQITLFGVRGERVRIRKQSPIAKLAVGDTVDFHLRIGGDVTSAGHRVLEVQPRPNNFGCDVARISGKSGWVATAALTRAGGSPNAQGGASTECELLILLAAAIACIVLAGAIDRRGVRVPVAWLKEYPDPVCELCGKVLDGTSDVCLEEVE
jgi:hypothetical protein